jgi:hypothetical protein
MAKKNKIEIGQCYSYHDRVFMIMWPYKFYGQKQWECQDTLTKEYVYLPEEFLRECRKPFNNFG